MTEYPYELCEWYPDEQRWARVSAGRVPTWRDLRSLAGAWIGTRDLYVAREGSGWWLVGNGKSIGRRVRYGCVTDGGERPWLSLREIGASDE